MTLDDYARLLEPAVRRGLPCLCTNPDRTMLTPTGPAFGSGPIAELYQRLGGRVTWVGKPYAEVFEATLDELGDPPRGRAVVIGDSIEHDIAGAHGVGAKGWLVLTGIIAGASDTALREECDRFGAMPDGALTAFMP
jgi:HAD superfamily hydrolase (TIGR01459 family)